MHEDRKRMSPGRHLLCLTNVFGIPCLINTCTVIRIQECNALKDKSQKREELANVLSGCQFSISHLSLSLSLTLSNSISPSPPPPHFPSARLSLSPPPPPPPSLSAPPPPPPRLSPHSLFLFKFASQLIFLFVKSSSVPQRK